MTDRHFMTQALAQARLAAAAGEVPVGALLVRNGQIVAVAHNLREHLQDATAHAELLVVRKACEILGEWRLTGCEVFVTLEPCAMCAAAMLQARISRVVYGTDDFREGAMGSALNLGAGRIECVRGVMADECRGVLVGFFGDLRQHTNPH